MSKVEEEAASTTIHSTDLWGQRSLPEEATSAFAPQNLEQDAPRTDWDRMSQPHENAASSSKIQNSKSNIPPLPSASLGDLCGFAVNLS
jgi:hypothetical protein